MGLFDRFKRKPPGPGPRMVVLLAATPVIEPAAACKALAAIEPLRLAPKITWDGKAGVASFDSHEIELALTETPASESLLNNTVSASNWTGEAVTEMRGHKLQLLLAHRGCAARMSEQFIALYKLADVLGGEQLRGVLIEESWTCAPAALVREFTGAAMLKACRDQPPPVLFTGFVKFKTDDGAWFASKGHHLFGVPDFAMHGPDEKPADVLDLFMNIFVYANTRNVRIAAGHTLQIADATFLKFEALTPDNPWREYLAGKAETLQLKRITKDEINKPAKSKA